MRGKDELKGTRSNFIPWWHVFEHWGENCLGVRELGLIKKKKTYRMKTHIFLIIIQKFQFQIYYTLEIKSEKGVSKTGPENRAEKWG